MMNTRSSLGLILVSLCCAFACSQKDPNEGLDTTTDETDTSDDTETTEPDTTNDSDTTGETSQTNDTSEETSTAPTSGSDTADVAPDTTETSTDDATDESDSSSDSSDTTSDSTTTDTSDDSVDLEDQICPMVAGATWTYKHTDWTEVQTVTATEYEGEAGFLVKDTPDPEDNLRADTVLVKRDGRLLRVYKDQYWVNPNSDVEVLDAKATYGVGFVRCDEAWATKEIGWSETPEYIRVETVGDAAPKAPEERSHTFTVEGREDVSTSNGDTYSNCVKVRRSKDWAAVETAEDATEKLYWFCPGVGKVREQNVESGNFEDLLEYSIPE